MDFLEPDIDENSSVDPLGQYGENTEAVEFRPSSAVPESRNLRFQWAKLKSVERCVEKVNRVYGKVESICCIKKSP